MRSVTYSMGVSLDGYIVGPDGDIIVPPPDEEVWRLVTDEIRAVGVHLMGRRLYETMLYWETADQNRHSTPPSSEVGRSLEAAPESCVLDHSYTGTGQCPPCLRRGLAGVARLRAEPGTRTSRSAARISPPGRPRWA